MNNSNPRITTFVSTTKDENNALKIIADFRANSTATLHWVLCKYIDCPIVRDEPEFIDILFNSHLNLIPEMFQWMLTPKVIAHRKKIKSNMDFFPYRCKEFMKDNICFYEKLYFFARIGKLPLDNWFTFLRRQNFDKETIMTALGYFNEVMVPFAKFEFPITTDHCQPTKTQNQNEVSGIMKILPHKLMTEILTFSHYEPVFNFIKTAVLVSIEDPTDYELSQQAMLNLLMLPKTQHIFRKWSQAKGQTLHEINNIIGLLDNICGSFKQLIANIQPCSDLQPRTQSFISIIIESKIIPYIVNEVIQSNFCHPATKNSEIALDLTSSLQITTTSPNNNSSLSPSLSKISSINNHEIILSDDYEEEDLMQIMLKILTYSVEIFIRIPKTVPAESQTQIQKIDRPCRYGLLVCHFHEQMQVILDNLDKMTKMVYNEPQSGVVTPFVYIPFSSGQKIKSISFMKYQFIKLLHNSLIMIQCPENFEAKIEKLNSIRKLKSINVAPFELKIQKLHIIQIVQKYLSKNRWNNIVHHLLEKVCHSLIICSYQYLRKNIQKSLNKKSTQNFLSFLIENFTQRHYIFLTTFKFTTQGNLQSIYNISKDLAYTLNSTNQLVILLNQFEPWKKYILNDLKLYQEKTYPVSIQTLETRKDEEHNSANVEGLKVDQVDSIRKLLQNITVAKKWPTKTNKNKLSSKSGIIRNSDQRVELEEQPLSKSSNQFYYLDRYRKHRNQPLKKTLDDILKKRVEYSIEFEADHQIQQVDVEDISVRDQLSRQKNNKDRTQLRHLNPDEYSLFKSYSVGKK